jgi:hypothetical protein
VGKKKDSKGLFEVLTTGAGKARSLGVPGWFGQPQAAQPEPESPPPLPSSQATPAAPAAPKRRRAEPREPILSAAGGRLRISLNHVSAVVVLAGLALMFFGAYQWGRHSVRPAVAQGPEELDVPHSPAATQEVGPGRPGRVLPVPQRPGRVEPARPGRPHPGELTRDDAARKKDYSYLVIQSDIPTYDEAYKVKVFLHRSGVPATIHGPLRDETFLVKDMVGFRNIRDPEVRKKIDERVELFHKLGQAYRRTGGNYGFRHRLDQPPYMITEH